MPEKTARPSPPENLNLVQEAVIVYLKTREILNGLPPYCSDEKRLMVLKAVHESLDLLARISQKK